MIKTLLILGALPLLLTFFVKDCARNDRNLEGPVGELDKRMKGLQKGTWAGEHIHLEVNEQGALIEYDCAHGTITKRIVLDAQGNFKVSGTHVRERGGPTRKDEDQGGSKAQFAGHVTGNKMRLKVTETDTGESLGQFVLTYGQSPRLTKCK